MLSPPFVGTQVSEVVRIIQIHSGHISVLGNWGYDTMDSITHNSRGVPVVRWSTGWFAEEILVHLLYTRLFSLVWKFLYFVHMILV